MNLQVALTKYKRGQLNSSHLPVIATQALNDGCASKSLALLAVENDATMAECGPLFEAAIKELGIEGPKTIAAKDEFPYHLSASSAQFLGSVKQAFERNNELLVYRMFAYTAGAGNRWYLIKTLGQWEEFLKEENPVLQSAEKTAYTVLLDCELPIRGVVSPEIIEEGLRLFNHYGDLVIAKFVPDSLELALAFFEWYGGRTGQLAEKELQTKKEEIRSYLETNVGEEIAMGRDFMIWQDEIRWITAYMPDKDGVVRPGAY